MSDTLKILEKAMNRSNGKAKIVEVPIERIPNHQQLKKLDTEILAQVGIYNSELKEVPEPYKGGDTNA